MFGVARGLLPEMLGAFLRIVCKLGMCGDSCTHHGAVLRLLPSAAPVHRAHVGREADGVDAMA
jgi:hypothetical protein